MLRDDVLQCFQDWFNELDNQRKLAAFADSGSPELWLTWELAYTVMVRFPSLSVTREMSIPNAAGRVDIVVSDAKDSVWVELKVLWNNNNRGKVIASSVRDALRIEASGIPGVLLVVAIESNRGTADDVLSQLNQVLSQAVTTLGAATLTSVGLLSSLRDQRQIKAAFYDIASESVKSSAMLSEIGVLAMEDSEIRLDAFARGEYIGCGQCGRFWQYDGQGAIPTYPDCGCSWRVRDGLRHCNEVMIAFWLTGLADNRSELPEPVPTRLGHRTLELLKRLRLDIAQLGTRHGLPPATERW